MPLKCSTPNCCRASGWPSPPCLRNNLHPPPPSDRHHTMCCTPTLLLQDNIKEDELLPYIQQVLQLPLYDRDTGRVQ